MNRIRHVLFLPIALIGIVISFYIVASIFSFSLVSLRESGFVFRSLPEGGVFDAIKWLSVTKIDWSVVLNGLGKIGGLILVCTIGASVATTALEIGAETELEPNHEFRAHGLANLACCAGRRLACLHPDRTLIVLSSPRSVQPLDADPAPSF